MSTVERIKDINIPNLFLFAEDDPIVLKETVDYNIHAKNKHIISIYTKIGAHIGWFEGIIPRRWYPKVCIEYINALELI